MRLLPFDIPNTSSLEEALVAYDIYAQCDSKTPLPFSFTAVDPSSDEFAALDMSRVFLCVGGGASVEHLRPASGVAAYAILEKVDAERDVLIGLPEEGVPDELIEELVHEGALLLADMREETQAGFDAVFPASEFSREPIGRGRDGARLVWNHELDASQIDTLMMTDLAKLVKNSLRNFASDVYCSEHRDELYPAVARLGEREAPHVASAIRAMSCGRLSVREAGFIETALGPDAEKFQHEAIMLCFHNAFARSPQAIEMKKGTEAGKLYEKLITVMTCWSGALAPVDVKDFSVPAEDDGTCSAEECAYMLEKYSRKLGVDIMLDNVFDEDVPLDFVFDYAERITCDHKRNAITRAYPPRK